MTAAHWLPKFSLRALLAAVAVAAVAVATLLNATPNVNGAAFLVVAAVYAVAAIAAFFYRRGARRAFAGGFLIAGLTYIFLLSLLIVSRPTRSIVPTSRALDAAYQLVVQKVPNPDYVAGENRPTINHPDNTAFHSIGHCCWSLLFGLAGGCVARRFHSSRAAGHVDQSRKEMP